MKGMSMFEADQSGLHRWPLVRIAPHGETRVVLLSEKFLPLTVHWSRRSMLCGHDDCPLCAWLPSRGLYYLACSCNSRVSMIEMACLSSLMLEQHCKLLHGGLRPGLELRLWRSSKKSPVMSEVLDYREGVEGVPLEQLAQRVMSLYQMPGPNPGETFEAWSARLRVLACRRGELDAKRLAAAAEVGTKSR